MGHRAAILPCRIARCNPGAALSRVRGVEHEYLTLIRPLPHAEAGEPGEQPTAGGNLFGGQRLGRLAFGLHRDRSVLYIYVQGTGMRVPSLTPAWRNFDRRNTGDITGNRQIMLNQQFADGVWRRSASRRYRQGG